MQTRTQTTLVAVFRDNSDAQAAADELRAKGFADDNIYISSSDEGEASTEYHEGKKKGWFKSLFSHEEAEDQARYDTALRGGHTVATVQTDEGNLDTAVDILNSHSPVDVHSETTGTAAAAGATTGVTAGTADRVGRGETASQAIPVVQEELRVGKRAVLRGGVRVYTRTVEQPVEENVRLREEKVNVERQAVNRPVNQADLKAGREQVIEVQEFAEEPVVSKEARVVEEVRVNKQAAERTETVRDSVRHTEVKVENLKPGETGAGQGVFSDDDFRQYFTENYGSTGANYEDYAPAYRYGYDMANDPRYQGKDFSQVESDLRSDYGRRYPNSAWDKMKDSIRYGWNKVTGRTRSATTAR